MIPPTVPASVTVFDPVLFLVSSKLLKVVAIIEGVFMVVMVRAISGVGLLEENGIFVTGGAFSVPSRMWAL